MQRHVAAHKPREIACVGFVGRGRVRCPTDSFARHGAKQGALGFAAGHRFNHQSDSQRETPAKRVAFAEVHQLCVVVFDLLQFGVLLLRQTRFRAQLHIHAELCCRSRDFRVWSYSHRPFKQQTIPQDFLIVQLFR